MNKISASFSVVLLIMMMAVSVVIISSPNNNPIALTKKISQWAVVGFSIKDEPKPPLAVVVPQSSKPAVKIFFNDTLGVHKKMFDDMVMMFDSVHRMSKDPMIDSIWKFVRPRLVFIDSLPSNPVAQADPIYVLPLLDSEDSISNLERAKVQIACYSENSEHGLAKCITFFEVNNIPKGLVVNAYHEAHHALMSHDNVTLPGREKIEHAQILLTECSTLFALMTKDTVLRNAYQEIVFNATKECSVPENGVFQSLSKVDQRALLTEFHALWFIIKDGVPHTEQKMLELYNKTYLEHVITFTAEGAI